MTWTGIALFALFGATLFSCPGLFYRVNGDASRSARLMRGYQAFGSAFMHLAGLFAFLKLVNGQ